MLICTMGAAASAQVASPLAGEAAAAVEQGDSVGGDIIVTALKRSESLQDVPAAVSVLSNEKLSTLGVTNLTQIGNIAPGISVTPIRTQAFIFIRGVGQTLTSPNADAQTATNFNGVYLPAEIAGTAFFDVDRVEVLPGPQGTLYGRNSTGGVVNLISRKPGTDFGIDGLLEIGNYSRVQARLGVDVPLSDTLSSRTAGTLIRHDGYFNNGEDDQKTWSVRETLVWAPRDGTNVTAVATYTHDGGIGNTLQNIPPRECGSRCATFDPKALGYYSDADTFISSLQVQQDLSDSAQLTYIGGYSKLKLDSLNTIFTGPPVAPLRFIEDIDSQSHELRLSGQLGQVDFVLGGYYFKQDATYDFFASPVPAQKITTIFRAKSHGEAAFGQVSYSITPELRLVGGLRYSSTTKSLDGFNAVDNAANVRIQFRPYEGKSTLNRLDWKAGVEFDVTPDSLLYANVATGFTPGGFSTGPAVVGQIQAASFEPVKLRAYTAGAKNKLFNGLMTLNVEGFYYDYKNYQVSARDIITLQNLVFNADKATIYGAQIDSRLNLGSHDEFAVGATYLDAKADRPITPVANYSGFALPYSPRWTLNAFYQHRFDLADGAELRGSVNFKYTSKRWSIYSHGVGFDIKSNTHTDLNFGYFADRDRWSLQAFVRNLEDSLVKTSCANAIPGPAGCFFEPPRTYGVTLQFNY
ncbi:hypothetical protein WP12_06810 [Sphingomonas sp. SRS2]|nr:hypothetical protein WP12_06810 [Sphingomonas sp. SRS2]